jgi:FKBP-type peptidyl-prolyl cis-trans isomerase 2
MQEIKKTDFIELEYIGKTSNGKVFDTNIKEEAEKMSLPLEKEFSFIILGQGMILKSIEEFLIGKKPGKYNLEIPSEKAFGKRQQNLLKTMPSSVFQNAEKPQPGMVFQFDNQIGKITSVSGGRITVDFNHPLAGKDLTYDINVKKIIENQDEKIKTLMKLFFNKEIPYELKEKKLKINSKEIKDIEKDKISQIKSKFKEILGLDLEIEDKK